MSLFLLYPHRIKSRLPVFFLLLTASLGEVLSDEERVPHPNIVLILADDVGLDAIGAFGGQSYQTTRIDQLAQQGTRFHHCYVMPVCHPTRTTLMTGRYPFRNGHPGWGTFPADLESETFASKLKEAGYATAVAGKWQLSLLTTDLEQPHRMGFDEYCLFGWHEGPRYYSPMIIQNRSVRDDTAGKFGPDEYCSFLIDFMERHRNRPFLAYYPMAVCHDVTDDLDQPVPYGPGKSRYDNFSEMVAVMDRCVGRLIDAIDRLEIESRTVVIFLTDNGSPRSMIMEVQNGKYIRKPVISKYRGRSIRGGKGSLTDGGTHVPLIVKWPGHFEGGGVSDQLVDTTDFYPTLLDIAGVKPSGGMQRDGYSFAQTLNTDNQQRRLWAFAEHRGRSWVRDARYKKYSTGKWFDLQTDPTEMKALTLDGPQVPLRVQQLLNSAESSLKVVRGSP